MRGVIGRMWQLDISLPQLCRNTTCQGWILVHSLHIQLYTQSIHKVYTHSIIMSAQLLANAVSESELIIDHCHPQQ